MKQFKSPPAQTNSGSGDTHWLDALLRESRPPVLADAGFTDRVLQHLPAPRTPDQWQSLLEQRRLRDQRFVGYTLGGVMVGSATALWGGAWPDTQQLVGAILSLLDLRPTGAQALAPWAAVVLCAGLLAIAMTDSME